MAQKISTSRKFLAASAVSATLALGAGALTSTLSTQHDVKAGDIATAIDKVVIAFGNRNQRTNDNSISYEDRSFTYQSKPKSDNAPIAVVATTGVVTMVAGLSSIFCLAFAGKSRKRRVERTSPFVFGVPSSEV